MKINKLVPRAKDSLHGEHLTTSLELLQILPLVDTMYGHVMVYGIAVIQISIKNQHIEQQKNSSHVCVSNIKLHSIKTSPILGRFL